MIFLLLNLVAKLVYLSTETCSFIKLLITSTRVEGEIKTINIIPPFHPLCHFVSKHGITAISTFSFAQNIDGEGAHTPAGLVLV